ncbi:MAG: preprotein translocase subunit SecE [Phycisphaeraceae bacterium]|nr:preprotein translocase subunit SecE [Phycisphaeraceae bacterium]
MALTIYKPGQGYWTRMLSAVGLATLLLAGIGWVWRELEVIQGENRIYIQAGVAVGLLVVLGALSYYLLNKPRVVDFMIATEAEMRKVNWPSRREVIGSTWVVVCGTLMMAVLLLVVDVFFVWFFTKIYVLVPTS